MPTHDQIGRHHGGPLGAMHEGLADVIGRWTVGKEDCSTSIPNLAFFRREAPTEPCACLVKPSIVLVVQGAKQLLIGDQAHAYNTERFLITSLDIPPSRRFSKPGQTSLPPPRNRATEASAEPSARLLRLCWSLSVACSPCSTSPWTLLCSRH